MQQAMEQKAALKSFFGAVFVFLTLSALLWLVLFKNQWVAPQEMMSISLGDRVFSVEVAKTKEEREKGLSMRENLPQNQGMLFVFDKPDRHGIWMKNMFFPIDILWLGEGGAVVYVVQNAESDSYPLVYKPPVPALYVLEVDAGVIKNIGIQEGDLVSI